MSMMNSTDTNRIHLSDNITADGDAMDLMAIAKQMHWTTSVIFGTIFLIIGLFGNICSLLVWGRKSMRSSTGYYLMAQAVADISVLVFFFSVDSITAIDPSIKEIYSFGVFFSYVGYPMLYLAVIVSIWMTVGVTVDRYIMVCWFQHAKDFCNKKRAFSGIGIITFLCFIINLPHFSTYYPVPDSERNQSDPAFSKTEFGVGHGSGMYEFWVHCMFLVLVPFFAIFILNLMIICTIFKSNRKMACGKSDQAKEKTRKSENQLTRLLLLVTFTFLILIALQCVTQCFFMLQPKSANLRIVNEAYSIAKLGVVINSSINFFLYCLSGKRFRKEFFGLFRLKSAGYDTSSSLRHTDSSSGSAKPYKYKTTQTSST